MRKGKGKNKKNTYELIIVIFLFAICTLLIVIGLVLYNSIFKEYEEDYRNSFVTIYSGVVGGFCTLYGVLLTLEKGRKVKAKDEKKKNTPEFYQPARYDISKAQYFHYSLDEDNRFRISNNHIYLQNTNKIEFIINKITIVSEGKTYAFTGEKHYIDTGKLFCICFYCVKRIEKVKIEIISLDKNIYLYDLDLIQKTCVKEDGEYADK